MIWKRRRIRENLYPAAATIECTLREHSIVMNKKAVCFGRHRKMLCRTHGFFCRIGNFVSIRQKNSARMRTRRKGRWLPRQPRLGARMCQGTFFLCDCRWNNKRRAGRCAPAGWYEKEVFQKKLFFIYALIIQVRCDRSLTGRWKLCERFMYRKIIGKLTVQKPLRKSAES